MLGEFLKKSWAEVNATDYDFKSNTLKHVIEIRGNELRDEDDSIILVYYNVYTGMPMIVLQHYNRLNIEAEIIPGYSMTKSEGVDEDGVDATEIVYILEEIKNALDS